MLDIPTVQRDLMGWHDYNKIDTMSYYRDNQYENGYASIQAITKQFFAAKPLALSVNGAVLPKAHIIDVLSRPNDDMSGTDFREALSVMSLVHDKVYIRVHHTGSKVNESNIQGFTFLEGVTELDFPQGKQYKDFTGNIYGEDEVLVLKNINPYNLDKGYSTAHAGSRWATLDDYMAAYQTGFFKNGAIPAGIFTIVASTTQEFDDIKRNMQMSHRGADKSNNVMYSHDPINPDTGMPSGKPAVSWQETSQTNKDLALDKLFAQVQKKIDSVYGVPASMRGDNDNNTYASVRVDQQIFIDNCIRPFSTKIWSRFTHELNRITGGLGYTITVDIETPNIAEEQKAFAEAENTKVTTLTTLITTGFTVDSSIEALQLPDSFKVLKMEDKPTPTTIAPVEDVPEVDAGDEVADAPAPEDKSTKSLEPINVMCKQCNRYLFKATGTTIIEDMPCPKCKATNNYKIVNELGDDATHTFTYLETEAKEIKYVALSKEMSKEQIEVVQNKVASVIRKQMEEQISKVDTKSKAVGDEDIEKLNLYAEEILTVVHPVISSQGMKQYLLARTIEGISGEDLGNFKLDNKQVDKYRAYLQDIVKSYADDTAENIRKSLDTSISQNLPVHEVQMNLQSIMNTDEYRVRRLALTETNRAGNAGSIYAMEKVQKDAGIKIEKVWQVRGDACEFCRAMDGQSVGVSETFVEKGDSITGVDGNKLTNNFVSMDVPTAHSNCGCYCIYKVIK
jgi:phage portal protein BeeE/phage FluMu protein Com